MMKTIDDALKYADTFDSPHNQHMSIVMLASEVRRLRDEVNGLTGSLDRAEKALKEAQEQEPVSWQFRHGSQWHNFVNDEHRDATLKDPRWEHRALYARPVPANLVESHQIKRDSNSLEFEGIKTAPAVAVPSDDERLAQAIQNHSPTAFANSVAAINKPAVAVPMGSILQKVMAALAPMLDEDQFATIESIAASGGHEPPTGAVPAEWREVLTELADDLSIELDMRYQSRSHYPSELRKYENEMQPVYRARALLQSASVPAVAVPAIDIETILDASTATMCQCLRSRLLASEVRRLRDEVNGLTGSLDRAEKALKEAQEQKPVAWINLNKWTPSNGPQCVTPEEYEKKLELLTKLTAVYAAPVPAVAVPAVPEEWREVMTELADDLAIEIDQSYPPERRAYPSEQRRYEGEMAIVNRARALLQSSDGCCSQDRNEVRHD